MVKGKRMAAKYRGTCCECGGLLRVGESIIYARRAGAACDNGRCGIPVAAASVSRSGSGAPAPRGWDSVPGGATSDGGAVAAYVAAGLGEVPGWVDDVPPASDPDSYGAEG